MQSTGHTSIHASQPVQLSARTTARSLGNFLRALPARFAMMVLVLREAGPRRGLVFPDGNLLYCRPSRPESQPTAVAGGRHAGCGAPSSGTIGLVASTRSQNRTAIT